MSGCLPFLNIAKLAIFLSHSSAAASVTPMLQCNRHPPVLNFHGLSSAA